MKSDSPLILGIDLGTSGVRIAIINNKNSLVYSSSAQYSVSFKRCSDWKKSCAELMQKIPIELKKRLIACSIDGTSGTLMACKNNGDPLGEAIPYFSSSIRGKELLEKEFPNKNNSLNLYSSIPRAMELIDLYGDNILLRHQADWISGWLLNNWEFGEEGNNIRLGWDLIDQTWVNLVLNLSIKEKLPKPLSSGSSFGFISKVIAKELGLPESLEIIAGTTDSNAAVIATNPSINEGVTVLGSTIVIKSFVQKPLLSAGVSNHLVSGQWIAGGASNAGGAVLKKFFSDKELNELSRQINPEKDSGLSLLPLRCKGERFPVDNPNLEPILGPRPISDSLYLHGLLEGLAKIEAQGWEKLNLIGAEKPKKIITIGGGAKNPQWRRIRERFIKIPIRSSTKQPAEGVAKIAKDSIEARF